MSEKSSGVTTGQGMEGDIVPNEMKLLADKRSIDLYLKLLESGSEKKRDIRLVVVGKKGAGKTSLIRRLFGEDITDVTSTNGIEIHKIKCRAMSDDGIWNKLDENYEDTQTQARLLKPYIEKLQEKRTIQEQVESHIEPPVTPQQSNQSSEQAARDFETMVSASSKVDVNDKEEYATFSLWDFAGDEKFYHTHQTFLSQDAMYLVVTKLNEADDHGAQALFRLWIDSIHCYSRLEERHITSDKKTLGDNDPPVVIVGTWKDAVTSEADTKKIEIACRENLSKYTNELADDERGHVRCEYFISNKDDECSAYQQIRQNILYLARRMRTWNIDYPLKFIQLEQLLQKKKEEFPIISYHEIKAISIDTPIPLSEEELILFLEFHHELRSLVYFRDLPDYIILDTQWLSDAFKCIVTAEKFQTSTTNQKKWNELYHTGKLNYEVLEDIFKKETTILYKHKNYILKVMEKFDIIIRPEKSEGAEENPYYYVPCMIKAEPYCDIYKIFNVTADIGKRSTWLCFKFRFLPPHLMNHLIASLTRKYAVAIVVDKGEDTRKNALFKGTVVFEIQKTQKLLVMTYPSFILIQVLEFGNEIKRGIYKYIANFVTMEMNKIIRARFKMSNVEFEKKWECGLTEPDLVKGRNDFSIEHGTTYFCENCRQPHHFTDEWSGIPSEQHQIDPYLLADLIPTEINSMTDKRSVPLYLNLLESGSEKKREIRLVIVGKKGAGKTSFIKRLFNKEKKVDGQTSFTEDTGDETSTNGIEIHRVKCKAESSDGTWNILDGNSEETELYARILKPLEAKLKKEASGTTKTTTAATTTTTGGVSESTNSEKKRKSQVNLQEAKQVRFQVGNKPKTATVHQFKPPVVTPNHDNQKIADDLTAMLQFSVNLHDSQEYATLLFWDFAGDEEFYHTHQTFLSPDAIYVVVTNLSEVDDKDAHDMFELWMNSIHCYCTLEHEKNRPAGTTDEMKSPPVILVGSHKDKVMPTEEKKIETICGEKLKAFLDGVSLAARSHIRYIRYISNRTDNDDIFREIRKFILELATSMQTWNTDHPLKFIQLEKCLQEKKKKLHIPIISFDDIQDISNKLSKPLKKEELKLFLEYHHATRALIYFEDLLKFIILDTQWLSHIFKCIVTTEKCQSEFLNCKMNQELDDLHNKGILQITLLDEIFKDKTNVLHQHVGHKDEILKVMEKFDIIIPATEDGVGKKPLYYVPCMVKRKPEGDIYDMINATTDKCKKSTWLCFKFEFLPPHLINHLIASLINYGVAKVASSQQKEPQLCLFKDTVVFQLKNTQSMKLLVMAGANVVKIQVLDFRDINENMDDESIFLTIARNVTEKLKNIVYSRFKMSNVSFKTKWECGLITPELVKEYHDFSRDNTEDYRCEICESHHRFKNEWAKSQRSEAAQEIIQYTGSTIPKQAVDITLSKSSEYTPRSLPYEESTCRQQAIAKKDYEPRFTQNRDCHVEVRWLKCIDGDIVTCSQDALDNLECRDSTKEVVHHKSDFSDILDQMMTQLVISIDDRRTIEQTNDQANAMLDIVIKRGEPNTSMCINVLKQNHGYEDLAEKLPDSSSLVSAPTTTGLEDVPDYKIRLQKNYSKIINTLKHNNQ